MNFVLLVLALVSHFGLRLAFYNRLNSFGWPRRRIKRIEKVAFVETWVTPFVIAWFWYEPLREIILAGGAWNMLPVALRVYGLSCLIAGGILFGLWIVWRPIFRVQHADVSRTTRTIIAGKQDVEQFARTSKCRAAAMIPGNQMLDLAVEHIDILLANLPRSLDGYRIAHLSDIHLTGHLHQTYLSRVIESASEWRPELFALTGDIVDVQECVGWLAELFGPASAPDGSVFILGNHDTRVSDPSQVRDEMEQAGWTNIGGRCQPYSLRQTDVVMMGNETPWFGRPSAEEIGQVRESLADDAFKICLSHSPDQYDWARRHGVDFLMCGHTHGGQGRLPLAGPILSPSWHGSRWASGDFYRAPTTMHVSRGLGGVHLLRINCRPELSLITLRRKR
ncbi:metallophosphoesterase [Aporhodopirellula aestuarii]|uniref:Metallophosphoesterase n=1 Tax=Aporhodopirellula aestuarii TaxID=2950107 RepID=A0ABT0U8F1_9BACT|nr:metallophosphoesterase [Aporhodopirellula aestuarii]MCM2373205.1 metallophosphoesterase [Aporhodopirellula aestuarii]